MPPAHRVRRARRTSKSFLLRQFFSDYVSGHEKGATVGVTDGFIGQETTGWSGLVVIDILAGALDVPAEALDGAFCQAVENSRGQFDVSAVPVQIKNPVLVSEHRVHHTATEPQRKQEPADSI